MKITDFPMLLIEDDPKEVVRVQEALAQASLVNPLRIVDDGRKAIAYLSGHGEYADRESHPFPALVFLDMTLAEPSGLDVLVWIRSQESLKNLPLILLTTSAGEQSDSASSVALGVRSCLAKPVDRERLLEMVKAIGMYSMILGQNRPEAGQPGVPLESRHVLVVDRDADFLRSITEAMRRRTPSIAVETASDGTEALLRLRRGSLDAIVYDRGIEESDDLRFLVEVRAMNAGLPVIVLCEDRNAEFAALAIRKGATGVLFKQVRLDQFSDQLHGLLAAGRVPATAVAPEVLELLTEWDSVAAEPYQAPQKSFGRRQDTDILGHQISFQETSWDLVRAAPKKEALDTLIRMYWKPLYFFVRQRGYANEEAKDIVQDFLAGALQRDMIPRADPLRGRFRTFLLAAMTNFLKDRRRSWGRLKRGGGQTQVSLDLDLGESRYARAARGGEPPETIVDRAWAKDLLGQCIAELEGKPSHLRAFDLQMRGEDYATIGKETGLTETAAKTAVHRLRVRLRGILRSRLSPQNASEEEVGREVAEFASLLG